MPAPIVGQQFMVDALVTNPTQTPAPTGSVEFDFGDGSPTAIVNMSYRVATATHTYSEVGGATITARYSGDSNFAPASTTLSGQILRSAPIPTLNIFGDSISAASNVASTTANWVNMVAYVEGWNLNGEAHPSYKVGDECPIIYQTAVGPTTYSAILLGANDFTTESVLQYQSSMLACTAWLLIPATSTNGVQPKMAAQSPLVAQSGSWVQSALYPSMGLSTNQPGASLTATIIGSTIYLGLSGTASSRYTVDVYVDGQLSGEYSPAIVHPATFTQAVPWGVRIPVAGSAPTDSHTVTAVCKTSDSAGCFVDWIGGNGFASPNQLPRLWLGEPYLSNATDTSYQLVFPFINGLREIGQNFQADGLGVSMVDVFDDFNGKYESQCLVDQIHPALCGHQIVAAAFIGAMDWTFTNDQRIDFSGQSSLNYSTGQIPVPVSATSGLPVALTVVSGPAVSAGNMISLTGVGTVTLQADQAGDAHYLPAASESANFQIAPAPVTVTLTPSSTQVIAPGTISVNVNVTSSGANPVSGTVTLLDGSTPVGSLTLDPNGLAVFANLQFPVGNHTLTGSFETQGNFAAGSSAPVTISVAYPPADVQISSNTSFLSVAAGQRGSISLNLLPSLGFNPTAKFACSGLPDFAACQFSANPLSLPTAGSNETVIIQTSGAKGDLALSSAHNAQGPFGLQMALGTVWWSPGVLYGVAGPWRRRKRGELRRKRSRDCLLAILAWATISISGCAGTVQPTTPAGSSTVTITAVAVQGAVSVTRSATIQLNVTN